MIALANLKQSETLQDYYKSFIKIAHLVEESEKMLISIFLAGLREYFRAQVKMNKPSTMVSTYRTAYARETIAATEKKITKAVSLKNSAIHINQNVIYGNRVTQGKEIDSITKPTGKG